MSGPTRETLKDYSYVKFAIDEARQAGKLAADARLDEIAAAGPKYKVFQADLEGKPVPGAKRYPMGDLCGFGWLVISDGRAPEISVLQKEAENLGLRISKNYEDTGFVVYIRGMCDATQYVSVKEAAYRAAAAVLDGFGFGGKGQVYMQSRLD